jgi:hypothetical protein
MPASNEVGRNYIKLHLYGLAAVNKDEELVEKILEKFQSELHMTPTQVTRIINNSARIDRNDLFGFAHVMSKYRPYSVADLMAPPEIAYIDTAKELITTGKRHG